VEVGDVRSWGCVEVVGVNLSCKRAAGRRTDILILGGCFAKIIIVLYIEYVHSQSNFAIRGERERNNAGEHNGVEGIMSISEGIMRIRNELAVAFILHRTSCFQPTLCAF
jgi:hypothetical protein